MQQDAIAILPCPKLVLPTEEGEAADDVLDAPEQCGSLQERSRSHCSYDPRDCDSMVARQAILR